MRSPDADRTLRLLLAGSYVFTVAAAVAFWAQARSEFPAQVSGILASGVLAAALLTLAVMGWLVLRRSASETALRRAQIEQLQARLEELPHLQERFVGHLAHEIKTPLTIVLNQSELLLRCGDDPAAVRVHAKGLADYVLHLSNHFDSFLRLARPLVQEDTSHHVPVYIHDLVVEVVRRSQSMARERGVAVVATLSEPGSEVATVEIKGDVELLEPMLENLLRNALRFSPRGSQVELQVQVRDESILLYVRDHGTGIAPAHLESVFDWSSQVVGTKLQSTGSGFGLVLAKRIAEHHRGTISLRNHPEGGCEVAITLPRWRAEGLSSRDRDAPAGRSPVARPA